MWYNLLFLFIRLYFSLVNVCQCWLNFIIKNRRGKLIVKFKLKIISHLPIFSCFCFSVSLFLSLCCCMCLIILFLMLGDFLFFCWSSKISLKTYIGIICKWCIITFNFCNFVAIDERTFPSCVVWFKSISISSILLLGVWVYLFSSKNWIYELLVLLVSPFFIVN